jgi:hypothetical protein
MNDTNVFVAVPRERILALSVTECSLIEAGRVLIIGSMGWWAA